MAKKQDAYYFDNFSRCVDCACEAARILDSTLRSFDAAHLKERLDELHSQEHAADAKKHELLNVLVRAFITPIDREDIMLLSQNIDELVDKLDDVLMRVYCNNVRSIRMDALELTQLLVTSCSEVKALITELPNFKRSKTLQTHIININTLEEKADRLYISCLRNLHTGCSDPIELLAWHEVYTFLEKCADACEHVADAVERVVMKNS